MALSVLQVALPTFESGGAAAIFPNPVTTGSTIVILGRPYNQSVSTPLPLPTDTGLNTYTKLAETILFGEYGDVYACKNVTGGSTFTIAIAIVTGGNLWVAYEVGPSDFGTRADCESGTSTPASVSVTSTADCLALAAWNSGNDTITAPTGWGATSFGFHGSSFYGAKNFTGAQSISAASSNSPASWFAWMVLLQGSSVTLVPRMGLLGVG